MTAPGQPCSNGNPPCGARPARLYPAGWRCSGCSPVFAGAYTPMPPAPRIRRLASPGPCRLCRRPSRGADAAGAVHPCCLAWQHVIKAGYPCPACQVAEIVMRQLAEMASKPGPPRAVRLPALPPLPAHLPDGTPYVPDPPAMPRCGACGQVMTVIVRGQRFHPLCGDLPAGAGRRTAARRFPLAALSGLAGAAAAAEGEAA